jgi:putative ABC transport system substrate-binding protein
MIPRALLPLRLVGALLCLLAASAPNAAGAAEVAILKSTDLAAYNQAVAGFKAAMPSTTTFIEYDMQGDVARGRKLAQRIRASDATLVLAVGLKAALAARLEIVDIPVIFCMVLDPAKYDLKAPNVTGISLEIPISRQFGALRSVLPSVKRIGILYDPDKTGELVEEGRLQARALGLDVVVRQVRSEKDVPAALGALIPNIDALWLVPDGTVVTEDSLQFLMSTALKANVPVLGFSSKLVRNGALVGLSVHYEDMGRQAGMLARKILLERYQPNSTTFPPDRFRLAVNLNTAKFLGIVIPPAVVSSADELY